VALCHVCLGDSVQPEWCTLEKSAAFPFTLVIYCVVFLEQELAMPELNCRYSPGILVTEVVCFHDPFGTLLEYSRILLLYRNIPGILFCCCGRRGAPKYSRNRNLGDSLEFGIETRGNLRQNRGAVVAVHGVESQAI
jgi:hypothetical protein